MLQSFIIIPRRRNWYQSKAHMRLPISFLLWLCAYLLPFPRYNDLLVEILRFRCFTHSSLIWNPTMGFLGPIVWKLVKNRFHVLHNYENCMTQRSLLLNQCTSVWQTDGRTRRLCRCRSLAKIHTKYSCNTICTCLMSMSLSDYSHQSNYGLIDARDRKSTSRWKKTWWPQS